MMMSDSELITAVRESVADVHTATPVEQILSRGRTVRTRRRVSALAAVLATAAAAAVAVTVLPASPPATSRPSARLAAWSVVKQPGGDVTVTIRELYDPAGLQRELRADGVPAAVTFYGHPHVSCRLYPSDRAMMGKIFPTDVRDPYAAVEIRPSALPAGAAVYINDTSNPYGYLGLTVGLVHTGPRCTGSSG
jgi:hypothetical protein